MVAAVRGRGDRARSRRGQEVRHAHDGRRAVVDDADRAQSRIAVALRAHPRRTRIADPLGARPGWRRLPARRYERRPVRQAGRRLFTATSTSLDGSRSGSALPSRGRGPVSRSTATGTLRRGVPDGARRPQPLVCTGRPVHGHADDRARLDDRERRAAFDPVRSRFLGDVAGVGRERLSAHLRRLSVAGRPVRRPVRRAQDCSSSGSCCLHAGLARVRSGQLAGRAPRRRAGDAGLRRRARLGGVDCR